MLLAVVGVASQWNGSLVRTMHKCAKTEGYVLALDGGGGSVTASVEALADQRALPRPGLTPYEPATRANEELQPVRAGPEGRYAALVEMTA